MTDNQTVKMARHVRSATVQNVNNDDDNTIDVAWTTGADVLRSDIFDGTYIERLSTGPDNVRLDRLNAGASFLDTHNAYELGAVIGSVVPGSARMEGGEGLCKIKLSASARSADTVKDIKDGIIRFVSVGYTVHAFTRTEATDGSPAIMTATDWEPCEVSAVPVPADAGAGIRMATRGSAGLELNNCIITMVRSDEQKDLKDNILADDNKKPVDDKVEDKKVADKEEAEKAKVEKNKIDKAAEKTGVKKDDVVQVDDAVVVTKDHHEIIDSGDAHPVQISERKLAKMMADAVAGERKRTVEIMSLTKRYGLEDSVGRSHCERGSSIQDVKDELLERLAERSAEMPISNVADDTHKRSLDDKSAGAAWGAKFKK